MNLEGVASGHLPTPEPAPRLKSPLLIPVKASVCAEGTERP